MNDSKKDKETAHIFDVNSAKDLWDSITNDSQTENIIHYFQPNCTYDFRMIGPFINVKRFYIPYEIKSKIDIITLTNLFNRQKTSLFNVLDKFNIKLEQITNSNSKYSKSPVVSFMGKLYHNVGWQSCVMVNALLINSTISNEISKIVILPLTYKIIANTLQYLHKPCTQDLDNIKLTGILAHNISIGKQNTGPKSIYNIQVDPKESYLTDHQIEHIYKKGLIDIKSYLKQSNTHGKHPFFYDTNSDFKLPDKFMEFLQEEISKKNSDEEIIELDKNMKALPSEALNQENNPLIHLSID